MRQPDERDVEVHGSCSHPNPFALFKAAGGGQAVELATLASCLGSASHAAAMLLTLERHAALPTGLLEDEAGGWGTLRRYVQAMPPIVTAVGRALMHDLVERVAAVEFPAYWLFGVSEDKKFVYSRIDAVTREADGLAVWEFKTRWGKSRGYELVPLCADVRQATFYAYMLQQQTKQRVHCFYIRYAQVSEQGKITTFTYKYRFDPIAFRAVLAHAMEDWPAAILA